jgi:hypothetical protein
MNRRRSFHGRRRGLTRSRSALLSQKIAAAARKEGPSSLPLPPLRSIIAVLFDSSSFSGKSERLVRDRGFSFHSRVTIDCSGDGCQLVNHLQLGWFCGCRGCAERLGYDT